MHVNVFTGAITVRAHTKTYTHAIIPLREGYSIANKAIYKTVLFFTR